MAMASFAPLCVRAYILSDGCGGASRQGKPDVPGLAAVVDDRGLDLVPLVVDVSHRDKGDDERRAEHDVLDDCVLCARLTCSRHQQVFHKSKAHRVPSSDCSSATTRCTVMNSFGRESIAAMENVFTPIPHVENTAVVT